MEDILDALCSCKIKTIQCTSAEPVLFYTQYISPYEFYLIVYNPHDYSDSSGSYSVFIKDTSDNEFIYNLTRGPTHTNIYKLQWMGETPLNYMIQLGCLQTKKTENTTNHILYVSLPTLIKNNLISTIDTLLDTNNLILLDTTTCNILAQGADQHTTIANKLGANILFGSNTCFTKPITMDTLFPQRGAPTDIDEQGCLLFDSTCRDLNQYAITQNKWDAILISTTHHEISDGRLDTFLHHMISTLGSQSVSDKHLHICVNRACTIQPNLEKLLHTCQSLFADVSFLILNIPAEHDIYIKNPKTMSRPFPKYGNASGPNLLFLMGMRAMAKYDTVLHLETDCKLIGDWVSRCNAYVNNCGQFLIAGALYDGKQIGGSMLNTHLNGVAFYKTGSPLFQKLLTFLETYICRNAQFGRIESGYDIVLRMCIDKYLETYANAPEFYMVWRYIHRMCVHTSLIANVSVPCDADIPIDYIQRLYNPAILHQK
jgi:hypothetical protein